MTSTTAKRVVLVSTLVVMANSTVRSVQDRKAPEPRVFLAASVVAFGLGLLAGPAPTFAASFAALWVTGALLTDGPNLGDAVTAAVGPTPTKTASPSKGKAIR